MKSFPKLVGGINDTKEIDVSCELALEALYRQETSHANSTRE